MINKILSIILALIIVLYPSIKTIGDVYYYFAIYGIIILLIIILIILRISLKIKIILITLLLLIFKNNLILCNTFFFTLIKDGYINKIDNRKDDSKFREIIYNSFNKCFKLNIDFSKLTDKPSIIVCNYCHDRLENLACILIPKNIAIIMRETLIKITKLDKLNKWHIYTKGKDSYENTKKDYLNLYMLLRKYV